MNYINDVASQLPTVDFQYWAVHIFAMLITVALIPRLRITNIFGAFLTVFAIVLLNSTIWSASLFFELPDSMTMHAVLLLLANGIIFWILVKILPGIEVEGLLPALAAPIVFTLITVALEGKGGAIPWRKSVAMVSEAVESVRDRFQGGAFNKLSEPTRSGHDER